MILVYSEITGVGAGIFGSPGQENKLETETGRQNFWELRARDGCAREPAEEKPDPEKDSLPGGRGGKNLSP